MESQKRKMTILNSVIRQNMEEKRAFQMDFGHIRRVLSLPLRWGKVISGGQRSTDGACFYNEEHKVLSTQ